MNLNLTKWLNCYLQIESGSTKIESWDNNMPSYILLKHVVLVNLKIEIILDKSEVVYKHFQIESNFEVQLKLFNRIKSEDYNSRVLFWSCMFFKCHAFWTSMIIYNQRKGGFWRLMEVMKVLSFKKKRLAVDGSLSF